MCWSVCFDVFKVCCFDFCDFCGVLICTRCMPVTATARQHMFVYACVYYFVFVCVYVHASMSIFQVCTLNLLSLKHQDANLDYLMFGFIDYFDADTQQAGSMSGKQTSCLCMSVCCPCVPNLSCHSSNILDSHGFLLLQPLDLSWLRTRSRSRYIYYHRNALSKEGGSGSAVF
jgi:hypothetical protein